jgi:hypothetical protein
VSNAVYERANAAQMAGALEAQRRREAAVVEPETEAFDPSLETEPDFDGPFCNPNDDGRDWDLYCKGGDR